MAELIIIELVAKFNDGAKFINYDGQWQILAGLSGTDTQSYLNQLEKARLTQAVAQLEKMQKQYSDTNENRFDDSHQWVATTLANAIDSLTALVSHFELLGKE